MLLEQRGLEARSGYLGFTLKKELCTGVMRYIIWVAECKRVEVGKGRERGGLYSHA